MFCFICILGYARDEVCIFHILFLSCQHYIQPISETADGDDEHYRGDAAVDVADCLEAEAGADLVHYPCDESPPAESAKDDRAEPDEIEPPGLCLGIEEEVGAGKEGKVEEHYGRVADGETEAREEILEDTCDAEAVTVLHERSHSLRIAVRHHLDRIAVPEVESVEGDERATDELKGDLELLYPVHYELKGKDRDHRIDEVAEDGAETSEESRQPPFIKGALDHEDARRSHWRTYQQADG